jgi:hypothetical protein
MAATVAAAAPDSTQVGPNKIPTPAVNSLFDVLAILPVDVVRKSFWKHLQGKKDRLSFRRTCKAANALSWRVIKHCKPTDEHIAPMFNTLVLKGKYQREDLLGVKRFRFMANVFTPANSATWCSVMDVFPNLSKLSFTECLSPDDDPESVNSMLVQLALKDIPACQRIQERLRVLELDMHNLGQCHKALWRLLPLLHNLEKLVVSCECFGGKICNARVIDSLANLDKLKDLRICLDPCLRSPSEVEHGLESYYPFKKAVRHLNLSSLTTLRLHSNRAADKREFLSRLSGPVLERLEVVELSGLSWAWASMASLQSMASLKSLALYGVGSFTVDCVGHLLGLGKLRSLTVASCGMTAAAWALLASRMLPRLEKFTYMGNASVSNHGLVTNYDVKPWVCELHGAPPATSSSSHETTWRLRELTLDSMAVSSREEWRWLDENIITPASETLVSLSLNGVKFVDPDVDPSKTIGKLRALRVLYVEKSTWNSATSPPLLPPGCSSVVWTRGPDGDLVWVGDRTQQAPPWVDAQIY